MNNLPKLVRIYRSRKYFNLNFRKNLKVTSAPIKVTTRKLKVNWSADLAKDLKAYHTQPSVSQIVSKMKSEIDKETKT